MAVRPQISKVAGFEWDRGNREKCEKHGVSITAIEAMFLGPIAMFPDLLHSGREIRFKAIGKDDQKRNIFVVFTLRVREGEVLIRPISARFMHKKEITYYEKEVAGAKNR